MMQSLLDKLKSFYDFQRLEIKPSRASHGTHHSCCTEPCQECFWMLLFSILHWIELLRISDIIIIIKQCWKLLSFSWLIMLLKTERRKPCSLIRVAKEGSGDGADSPPELSHRSPHFITKALHMCIGTWPELLKGAFSTQAPRPAWTRMFAAMPDSAQTYRRDDVLQQKDKLNVHQ